MRSASNDTQWYEDQEDIHIVAEQCDLSNMPALCRNPHELVLTVRPRCMSLTQHELAEATTLIDSSISTQ